MTTTANQQAALEQRVAREVYFVEFDFASGMQRICSALQTMTWGGYEWLGVGAVNGIGIIEETRGTTPRALNFQLNGAKPEFLALAVGDVEEYRGRSAALYFCPLDEQFRLIDTPVRCWTGKMQTVAVSVDKDSGGIALNCETSAFDLRRAAGLRRNAAQHKKKYPGDRGYDFQDDLIKNPPPWLTKRFQSI